ncbi:uncharacterized protein SPSK_01132 [Sporothrix schenckii 1099-18]|uniref:CFEM domain-containing protein n=1 Tax=Sporothrix schenckii 1099-18 TaxID=1397361 RepID=A0A0F2LZQ2_SPOSC|nr:uncharacterized protein SPSK_01132 [Sporothrix schenckii 1099-18]KJR81396.1 hypothetical protein SPSK_01132 [Sporothrix schenckii 1099-18]
MHRSLLVLAGLVPSLCGASVLRPRDRQAGVPDDGAPAPPRITTAPVVHVRGLPGILRGIHDVDRRAAADSVPACAAPCIESALTDDTTCSAHDLACGCKYQNAVAIETAASSCVESACGYLGAFSAWVTLESICATYAYTDAFTNGYTVPGGTATVTKTNGGGATKTAPGGSGAGATTTVTAGAGSSGSGSGSGSGSASGSGSNMDSVSSSSNGLSKGAIAGIAVGAAVGAIALCAVLFLVYRYTKRNNALSADGAAAATTSAPSHPPASGPSGNGSAANSSASPLRAAAVPVSGATAAVAVALPAGQNELDGKSSAVVSTVGSTPTPPRPSASPSSPASVPTVGQTPTPQLYDQNGVPLDAAAVAVWQQQYSQQYAQQHPQYGAAAAQPYLVQGYSITPGQAPQPQTVVAPAGYAAAHPSLPVPGVVYQEAPAGIPQAQYPHELPGQGAGAGAADMASPVPQHVVPVAVGPSAALPVAAAPSTATPIHKAPTPPQA